MFTRRLKSLIFAAMSLMVWQGAVAQQPAKKPNIVILATGGTIAGAAATGTQSGYTSGAVTIDAMLAAVPGIDKLATVKGEQIANVGSQDMSFEVLLKVAKRINELAPKADVDGFVITHGTDTMEESAYFLNLTVKTNKPVVMVGSMRPSTAVSADGPLNLYNAVAVAGDPNSKGRGVVVVMNDQIHAAHSLTKTSTTALEFDISSVTKLPRVDVIFMSVDMSPDLINASVAGGAKGIVLAGVGNGNLNKVSVDAAAAAVKKGVVVVRASRVPTGLVGRNVELDDDKLGFIASDELNPQKARILLALALLKQRTPADIQKLYMTY
jgi:L-asparaginase